MPRFSEEGRGCRGLCPPLRPSFRRPPDGDSFKHFARWGLGPGPGVATPLSPRGPRRWSLSFVSRVLPGPPPMFSVRRHLLTSHDGR